MAAGLLAYLDREPIGWCALGPRTEMGRLRRSRAIPVVDELPVWSVVCFVVRAGVRRVVQTSAHSGGLPRWLVRYDLAPR